MNVEKSLKVYKNPQQAKKVAIESKERDITVTIDGEPIPFQILKGGYEMYSYDNGASWNQVDKQSKRLAMHQTPHSRWALYRKKHHDRKKSTFKVR